MKTKCPTKYCRNKRGKGKGGCCSKCQMRRWRTEHPDETLLARIKWRAKIKKVPFDLEIISFCIWLERHEHDPKKHHIDRRVPEKGYVLDNLQVLPIHDNIAKGNRERRGEYQLF